MIGPPLVPLLTYVMNSQVSKKTGFSPSELFLGRPSFKFDFIPDPEISPSVKDWMETQILAQEKACHLLEKKRASSLRRQNKTRKVHQYIVNDYVLVHKNRFSQQKFRKIDSPWVGPFRFLEVMTRKIKVASSPSLGGEILVSIDQCKAWRSVMDDSSSDEDNDPEDDLTEDTNEENIPTTVKTSDISSSSTSVQPTSPQSSYEFEKVIKRRHRQGWKFLTIWKGFPVSAATWEPLKTFILPDWRLNEAFLDFCRRESLDSLIEAAEQYARLRAREANEMPPSRFEFTTSTPHRSADREEEETPVHTSSVLSVDPDLVPIEPPENMQRHVHFREPMCTYHAFEEENFTVRRKRLHTHFSSCTHRRAKRDTHKNNRNLIAPQVSVMKWRHRQSASYPTQGFAL